MCEFLAVSVTVEATSSNLVPKNFKVIEKIGTGAFGEVFRCYDESKGADFAMKRVNLAGTAADDDVQKAK